MEYSSTAKREVPAVNEPGFAHLAFEVSNLQASIDLVLRSGGSVQGEITNLGTKDRPHFIVYVRDPEGNILELEQTAPAKPDLDAASAKGSKEPEI